METRDMTTTIVEAAVNKGGERVMLGIMNLTQALALPYDDLEFSNPCPRKRTGAEEHLPFLARAELIRLFDRS